MERKCSKCSGEMELGFIVDKGYSTYLPAEWIEGAPEIGALGMAVKLAGRCSFWTETWRCKSCGYLDFYALKPREAR